MLTLNLATSGGLPAPTGGREVNVWRDERGEICARLFNDGVRRWIDWPALGVFAFAPGAGSVRVWPAPGARWKVIADTFARVLQPAILQALGWQALHASAVLGPDGVLGFCGVAHSGKSTFAYALREAGHPQFADDALVVRLEEERVIAQAMPFAPRLRPASRVHFAVPDQSDRRSPTPASLAAPLAAVLVLAQDETLDRPRLLRIPPARAFSALLTHAHCFDLADASESRRIVQDYLEIARRIPVFALTYRPDFARLPELVEMALGARGADERTAVLR